MYKCSNPKCGKEFDVLEFIRCPYCGGKVLFKKTPPVAHKVKAI
ncbi:MAG: DNA-directed RNA polymerase subunit P [Candidatus Micrarchaeia archaeon]|jgi:DNA-directed RNA polymerase subunit RPC12/RpoP